MPRSSRIPDSYRRRLRLSSRDVLVAAALTALAGGVIVAALWKTSPTDGLFPNTAVQSDLE